MCEGGQAAADRQRALRVQYAGAAVHVQRIWDAADLGYPRFVVRGHGYSIEDLGHDREQAREKGQRHER